jgi:hypothetical protein
MIQGLGKERNRNWQVWERIWLKTGTLDFEKVS